MAVIKNERCYYDYNTEMAPPAGIAGALVTGHQDMSNFGKKTDDLYM